MKTEYAVAIARFLGIGIGGVAVQALHAQAKPSAYIERLRRATDRHDPTRMR
jgi:hypothetical protein